MSAFTRRHFFFKCEFCGSWLYSDRILLTKKCTNSQCGRIIDFAKVRKHSIRINPADAHRVMQYLKNRHNMIEPEFMMAYKLIGGFRI